MTYAKAERLYVEREKPVIKRDAFSNVNQIGYVTIEQQVTSLIIAGERLLSYKRQMYEFPDGEYDEDSVVPDPTLRVGFDPADFSFYQSQYAERIKAMRKKVESEEKEPSVSSEDKTDGDAV